MFKIRLSEEPSSPQRREGWLWSRPLSWPLAAPCATGHDSNLYTALSPHTCLSLYVQGSLLLRSPVVWD